MKTFKVHKFEFMGKERTLFTRSEKPGANWYLRLQAGGKDTPVCLNSHIVQNAMANARDVIRATIQGTDTFAQLRQETRKRADATVTLGALEQAYRDLTAGRLAPRTVDINVAALKRIVTVASGAGANDDTSLAVISADLVDAYKKLTLRAATGADPLRARQMKRSANAMVRLARSLFAEHLVSGYRRDHAIELPKCVSGFMAEPGFIETAKGESEYRMPGDALLSATFASLETLKEKDRNAYLAVWLAIGFGLRKGEISGIRGRNLTTFRGTPHVEIEEVWQNFRMSPATKNGEVRPRIACTNGAWEKIEPFLIGADPDAYLLTGDTTERTEKTFRRISTWMRKLGWQTEKAIHEWRAFAGCQVAQRDGIYAASRWLRHSSVSVTERNYARYVQTQVTSAPVSIGFTPRVIAGSNAGSNESDSAQTLVNQG